MNNDNAITLTNENGAHKVYKRIPDLWHIAHKSGVSAEERELILLVWHMAHDLKACVEGQGEAGVSNYTDEAGIKHTHLTWGKKS